MGLRSIFMSLCLCCSCSLITLLITSLRSSLITASQKKTLMNSESWFPLCLPGFNAQGFLYCYCYCLHEAAGMFLMLISNVNTPEMFHGFQSARVAIGEALGVGEGDGEGDGEGEGWEVVKGVLKSMEDWERRVTER